MINQITSSISLTLEDDKIPIFFPLLQHGFMVKAQVGCSIKTLICEDLGVDTEYVEDRIKTIFLDGKPVDDVDSAIIKDGSTLALSAAMPGLVGATFRRGGYLASFRSTITHQKEEAVAPRKEGTVVLKLFNLMVRELGPAFLDQGIWINRHVLKDFLRSQPVDFWTRCKTVKVDGQEIGLDRLSEMNWFDEKGFVLLRVIASDQGKKSNDRK